MPAFDRPLSGGEQAERILGPLDACFDRVYTARWNPLYQSGTLVAGTVLVMLVTGLYLLLFYRTGSPYESVAAMDHEAWGGRWIRSLHRYSADLAIVATVVHAARMFLQGKTWGPRVVAWLSGVVLLGLLLLSGWTGMVLVWDVAGQAVAVEGAKLLDLLPLFSEPISRSFVDARGVGSAFFFLNLVVHIALPLVMGVFLLVHTSRLARPHLLPPRGLWWSTVGVLLALSIVLPAPLLEKADLLRVVGRIEVDGFYAFWLPLSRTLSPGAHLAVWAAAFLVLASVPWWWRPRPEVGREPSFVDEKLCTGCTQCYLDCPYEAITMVPRTEGRGSELVARVNPDRCVSCGICAGSCAPMGVGPPLRTGREQLEEIREFVAARLPDPRTVVVFSCRNGVDRPPALAKLDGVEVRTVHCAGALHSSVVEYALRRGFGGVCVLAGAERNCVYREGSKWLEQRLFHDREAELKDRVDKSRVWIGGFGAGQVREAVAAVTAFRDEIRSRAAVRGEGEFDVDTECEVPEDPEASVG